jgi:hypothetical protein
MPTIRHIAELRTGNTFWALTVSDDMFAVLASATNNVCDFMVELPPDDNGADVAICGEVKIWCDQELALGRAKVRRETNAKLVTERVEMALADVPLDAEEIIEALECAEIDPKRIVARLRARVLDKT